MDHGCCLPGGSGGDGDGLRSSRLGRFERQLRSPGGSGDGSGFRFAIPLSLPGAAAGRGGQAPVTNHAGNR